MCFEKLFFMLFGMCEISTVWALMALPMIFVIPKQPAVDTGAFLKGSNNRLSSINRRITS